MRKITYIGHVLAKTTDKLIEKINESIEICEKHGAEAEIQYSSALTGITSEAMFSALIIGKTEIKEV